MKKIKLINKQNKKRSEGKCYFCDVDIYEVLDCHRILPGEEGGIYTDFNTIVTCASCHRKIHANYIKIDRKYFSTSGKWILHYWNENGEEKWK